MQPSPISGNQALKILKALAYSFGSGFVGGVILSLANTLQTTGVTFNRAVVTGLVIGGVVGGLNTIAVTVKQVFSEG